MWDTVDAKFVNLVLDFFASNNLAKPLNMMWVTLITKFEGASEMKDFRPISMVGCIYKVIAKILVRMLRGVMNDLVGESQLAFL